MPCLSDLFWEEDSSLLRFLLGMTKQSKLLLSNGEEEEGDILPQLTPLDTSCVSFHDVDTVIIHILDTRKLRSKERKWSQPFKITSSKKWNSGSNQRSSVAKAQSLATIISIQRGRWEFGEKNSRIYEKTGFEEHKPENMELH